MMSPVILAYPGICDYRFWQQNTILMNQAGSLSDFPIATRWIMFLPEAIKKTFIEEKALLKPGGVEDWIHFLKTRMRIALAQLNYHIGDFENKRPQHCNTLQKAKIQKADLVIFCWNLPSAATLPRFSWIWRFHSEKAQKRSWKLQGMYRYRSDYWGAFRKSAEKGKSLYNTAYFPCRW